VKLWRDPSESEVLALAIANEEEDSRIYLGFAAELRANFPASAKIFEDMAVEEQSHRHKLFELYREKFGHTLPRITRRGMRGFSKWKPFGLFKEIRLDIVRRQAERMESEAGRFYIKAAERSQDARVRTLLSDLAADEKRHENLAARLRERALTADVKAEEDATARRLLLLQVVQPGLAGLIDGAVSNLAPIFAAAFATHNSWNTFLIGSAASIGAGISMGLTEALSDDGKITDRGHPWLRGSICGLMTALGGFSYTLPFLISDFWMATVISCLIVSIDLFVIAWVRWKYMETQFTSAMAQIILGGFLVLLTGIFIGSS